MSFAKSLALCPSESANSRLLVPQRPAIAAGLFQIYFTPYRVFPPIRYTKYMNSALFVGSYVAWHYGAAFKRMYGIWTNFLWFCYHFFSLPVLLKTFFAPWERMHESYGKRLDPEAIAGAFIVNMLLRLVGMTLRLAVIVVGVAMFVITCIGGVLFFIAWALLPVGLLYLIFFGITNIVHG